MTAELLSVRDLAVHFEADPLPVRAVDGVSLTVHAGETLALVGESGCGKSTLARAVMGLAPPTAGEIRWAGEPLPPLGSRARRPFLSKLQMVFQDPDASLDPRVTVGASIAEPLLVRSPRPPRRARDDRTAALMRDVGLDPVLASRYPHELSGGQRQRVCIARALAVEPELLVCDEAVSALDVSVQAQILNLLADLRDARGLTYLFITHDLRVVRHLATRVAVMYLGQIVEEGPTSRVFEAPAHPYTRALLSAVPSTGPGPGRPRVRLALDLPSPTRPPPGCRFHPRCPEAMDRCRSAAPETVAVPSGGSSRCHLSADAVARDALR